jgi:hypothetical protein
VAATVVALGAVCTGTAAAAPSASGVTSCAPDQQVRLVAEARGVVTLTWRENGTVAHTQSYGLQMVYGVLELDTMASIRVVDVGRPARRQRDRRRRGLCAGRLHLIPAA